MPTEIRNVVLRATSCGKGAAAGTDQRACDTAAADGQCPVQILIPTSSQARLKIAIGNGGVRLREEILLERGRKSRLALEAVRDGCVAMFHESIAMGPTTSTFKTVTASGIFQQTTCDIQQLMGGRPAAIEMPTETEGSET